MEASSSFQFTKYKATVSITKGVLTADVTCTFNLTGSMNYNPSIKSSIAVDIKALPTPLELAISGGRVKREIWLKKAYRIRKVVHSNQNECSKKQIGSPIYFTLNRPLTHLIWSEYYWILQDNQENRLLITPISLTLYYREIVLVAIKYGVHYCSIIKTLRCHEGDKTATLSVHHTV